MWNTNQQLLKSTDYNKQIYSQVFTNGNNEFYRRRQNLTYASAFRTYSKKLMVTLKFYQHMIHFTGFLSAVKLSHSTRDDKLLCQWSYICCLGK